MSATMYYTSSSAFMEHCHIGNHVWADKNAVLSSSVTILYIFFG